MSNPKKHRNKPKKHRNIESIHMFLGLFSATNDVFFETLYCMYILIEKC